MFKNDLKIAWRNLLKHKMFAAIKIGGFALSIAACLLIGLYIKGELSYDKSWKDHDRIYRLTAAATSDGVPEQFADWPSPTAAALKEDFPEVEKVSRLMFSPLFTGAGSNQVKKEGAIQNAYEEGFCYVDNNFLGMLQMPMIHGSTASALSQPKTIAISQTKAEKYFPGQDPVGKLLILNNDPDQTYSIGGVFKDFPANSHLHYDFLLTMQGHELWKGEQETWNASNYTVYFSLKEGTDPKAFQQKAKSLLTKRYFPALAEGGYQLPDEIAKSARIIVEPITDIHLRSAAIQDRIKKSDIKYVWMFAAIGLFILVIACINFINLSTAKAATRAKEVGLRKVVGSHRQSLIRQFLTESLLYSFMAFVMAIMITLLAMPYLENLISTSFELFAQSWWLIPLTFVAAGLIGIVAGIYPAMYISSFKPSEVLKGQLKSGKKNALLRNGLVVFQFATSVVLIISTMVIYYQTHYILHREVGFDKDQVMLVQGANTLKEKSQVFKNTILQSAHVQSVSLTDYLPVQGTKRDMNTFYEEGKQKMGNGVPAQKWQVDVEYMSTMGIRLQKGRNFVSGSVDDSTATVINKAMAAALPFKDPVGKTIENGWQKFHIIGVMEDFNFESMREKVTPLCLVLGKYNAATIAVKFKGDHLKDVLADVSGAWAKVSPEQPFRYTFLDERFANMYEDVERTGNIFTGFSILAIIIACLGLFALTAFVAEQRTKEVGVRKVLGANVPQLATLLSGDFIKLVILAIIIASPLAWWLMNKWLEDFAYRTPISPWIFAIAGGIAIAIALVTMSFHTIKAAAANPVKSLRTE